MPLLVLLFIRMVQGAFAGVLVLLCLALGAVENHPVRLLARGVAGDDVEELLGSSRALTSQLVNQGLTGGPRQKSSYDIGIGDVGELIALQGEAPDVPMKSFPGLLSMVFEIPQVLRMHVCAIEVSHKGLFQVRPTLDYVGQKVFQPCSHRIGQE